MIGFCVGDVTPTYGKSIEGDVIPIYGKSVVGIPVSVACGRLPCALS